MHAVQKGEEKKKKLNEVTPNQNTEANKKKREKMIHSNNKCECVNEQKIH